MAVAEDVVLPAVAYAGGDTCGGVEFPSRVAGRRNGPGRGDVGSFNEYYGGCGNYRCGGAL